MSLSYQKLWNYDATIYRRGNVSQLSETMKLWNYDATIYRRGNVSQLSETMEL